jgi:competence ComEA-like helix-hairpin-helix protein
MGFKNFIREYFTFNRRERNGVFVLLSIILLLILYLTFADFFTAPEKIDLSGFEQEIASFESEQKRVEDSISASGKHFSFSGNTLVEEPGVRNEGRYPEYSRSKPVREAILVEVNSADTTELKKIRGIGAVFAKRIVKFRDELGGFERIEQLREVFGIDEDKFKEISSQISIDTSRLIKMNVNTASVEDLNRHPYLSKKGAVAIFTSRVKSGDFTDLQDVKKVTLMSDSSFSKLLPYLTLK